MSSKRHSDVLGSGRKPKRQRQRCHLYFVVNDGDGYAIRKTDLSSDYDSDDDAARHEDGEIETVGAAWSPLPRVLLRLPAQTGEYFVASGTKILLTESGWPKRAVPAFDVRTRSLTPGPRPQTGPLNPIYMPLSRSLVSLDFGSAEFLDPPPPDRSNVGWSWERLEQPPFGHEHVICHAAHPDGRTLFVSTESCGVRATFTFDADDVVWRKHGDWKLPFKGPAVFDPALDAWVGLSGDKRTLGHLCSCDVATVSSDAGSSTVQPLASDDAASVVDAGAKPTAGGVASTGDADPGMGSNPPPAWKLCKEKLFCEDPAEKHHGAALVYMGGKSKFCLLQCVYAIDENEMDSDDDEADPGYQADEDLPRGHVLRLTTFTLKYDKSGQLRTAKRRRVRCYELLSHARPLPDDIRAFWI